MSLLSHLSNTHQQFFLTLPTLYLATENIHHQAEPSYAPFVYNDGCFYIFISELASHTRNILKNSYTGVLLIEPDETAKNLFARHRLSLHCTTLDVARNHSLFEPVITRFTEKYGDTIDVLKSLNDFHLIQLTPTEGTLVEGFRKTSMLNAQGLSAWKKT